MAPSPRPPAREALNAFAKVMSREEWQKMVDEYARAKKEMERAQ